MERKQYHNLTSFAKPVGLCEDLPPMFLVQIPKSQHTAAFVTQEVADVTCKDEK